MNMVPDQVMTAIDFAESVMAKEKNDRIGSSAETVYPMKFFLFHGQKEITGLLGSPFHHPALDDKDVMSLVIRMFAIALDAQAVLHATEAWNATQCAVCGTSVTAMRDEKCSICSSEMVPPSENPHREEVMLCTLSVRDHNKAFFWTSRFERDGESKITSFTNQLQCVPMEASGRFMDVWKLETWMGPHFAINLPTVLDAVGRQVSDKAVEIGVLRRKWLHQSTLSSG